MVTLQGDLELERTLKANVTLFAPDQLARSIKRFLEFALCDLVVDVGS